MNDQTLAGDHPLGTPNQPRLADAAVTSPHLEAVLTLDEVMNSARRAERTARICLRADLQAEYAEAVEELASLVDVDGKVVTKGDQALSDGSRAEELAEQIRDLRTQMLAATRRVRFRAMASDDWDKFLRAHRDDNGEIKDPDAYHAELIARCAIAPTMSVDDVHRLRTQLGPDQVDTLATTAYMACTSGGLDVPKLPSFLPGPKPPASATN